MEKLTTGGDFIKKKSFLAFMLAGGIAGTVNGLFGSGGGLVLVPILTRCTNLKKQQIFSCSVSIILPICVVSVFTEIAAGSLPLAEASPYLTGGIIGGILAGLFEHKIPTKYLHHILGALIIWGGIRYLC